MLPYFGRLSLSNMQIGRTLSDDDAQKLIQVSHQKIPNHQYPTFREAPSTNIQNRGGLPPLDLEICRFIGIWVLGVGSFHSSRCNRTVCFCSARAYASSALIRPRS